MIQIWFRTQEIPTSRQAEAGNRAKIHSWSTFHCVFKIRESARFTAKIHNPCAFLRPNLSIRKPIYPRLQSMPRGEEQKTEIGKAIRMGWNWCYVEITWVGSSLSRRCCQWTAGKIVIYYQHLYFIAHHYIVSQYLSAKCSVVRPAHGLMKNVLLSTIDTLSCYIWHLKSKYTIEPWYFKRSLHCLGVATSRMLRYLPR